MAKRLTGLTLRCVLCALLLPGVSAAAAGAEEAKRPLMQVGPWYPATYNVEEPYLNIIHASSVNWHAQGLTTEALYEQGVIDPETGLPVRLPDGKWLQLGAYFGNNDIRAAMHWDGEWVLEWEGDADLHIARVPKEMQWRSGKNRIEFTLDLKRAKTTVALIEVRKLKTPLMALRLFRKENEALVRAGKIASPAFAAAVSRYDIVRTMDLQGAGANMVRSVDDLPDMKAPFWGNKAWLSPNDTPQPFRSAPVEAMMALAMETDTALWAVVPIALGAPAGFYDPSIRDSDKGKWVQNFRRIAEQNGKAILASPEWDRYADYFVRALIDSGYPETRTLYVTVENEVWNTALQYIAVSEYAAGLAGGAGYRAEPNIGQIRLGYGVASARWKLALDDALRRAGRKQDVVYVIEGMQGWTQPNAWALEGARRWMEAQGETWLDHAPRFGTSVTSYWGDGGLKLKPGEEKDFAAAIENFVLNGSARQTGTRATVLRAFREEARLAAREGARFIGAYEGGASQTKPEGVSDAVYQAFLWGDRAARINKAVNDALAAEFPGVILSNYVLSGARGAPWFDSLPGEDNPYSRSWEPYLRPAQAPDTPATAQ